MYTYTYIYCKEKDPATRSSAFCNENMYVCICVHVEMKENGRRSARESRVEKNKKKESRNSHDRRFSTTIKEIGIDLRFQFPGPPFIKAP